MEIICREIPVADKENIGGIKVGEDFDISEEGVLNIKDMDKMSAKINDLVDSVTSGKELIAEAITDRGIDTSSKDSFSTMADNIRMIGRFAGELPEDGGI